jgi:hypothetical protein
MGYLGSDLGDYYPHELLEKVIYQIKEGGITIDHKEMLNSKLKELTEIVNNFNINERKTK